MTKEILIYVEILFAEQTNVILVFILYNETMNKLSRLNLKHDFCRLTWNDHYLIPSLSSQRIKEMAMNM